jgi:predicted peptidase
VRVCRITLIAIALALGLAGGATGAVARGETGFLNRSVSVDGASHRYQVYVPADYTRGRAWPVMLCLHGSGERGTDGLLQTEIGFGTALRRHSDRWPVIAVFPQCPPDVRWPGAASRIALAALDATLREFHCDPDRVGLTGLSMGGNGAWYLAYRDPARWAAILVACGWVTPLADHPTAEPVVPAADGPAIEALAKRLRRVPVWQFHGALDDVIAPANSRELAAALDSLGAPARYTELPGVGHGSWDAMYASPEVAKWLIEQRRHSR